VAGNILKVKINIPPLSTGILKRPNILEKLEEGLNVEGNFTRPLTLVSAPAGSGKTTLARKWLSGREERAAWFSLNEGDNEPARFWLYFISALQTREKNTGKGSLEMMRYLAQGTEPPGESETLLTPLLNDLFALEEALILVLDDYHHITDPRIQEDMTFFIENLPPKLHLLVTTRSDPPWPMPRWRARGKMREIRHSDLKFSREETTHLFNEVMGIGLAESQLNSLYNKTEGWITGLQLAAFSLVASENSDEFIESFAGSHRHVFHFLSEEVFARQPEPVREFLMQTSILRHLCVPLCNAVTGRDDAAEMLAHLERNQLFAIPQDERGEWYRYHSLFADLLLHHLKQYYPGKELELHERASSWFLEAGMPGEAIQHALNGKNWEQVAHILHEYLEQIVQLEGPGRLLHCYNNLPAPLLEKYPRLIVHKAIISLLRGSEESGDLLEQAESLGYESKKEQEEFRGILAAVKAHHHISRHEFSPGLEKAEEALKLLPTHSSFWRGGVAIFSGDARLFSGNPKGAYPFYLEALRNSQKYGGHYLHLTSGFKVANVLYDLGRLQESEELTAKALRTAEEKGLSVIPRAGLLLTLQGELLREKGKLEEAEHWIERGITISKPEKISLGWNYLFKAALYFSKQEYGAALEAVKKIRELDQELGLPKYIMFPAASWEARILLELGKLPEAKEMLYQAGVSEEAEIAGGYEWGLLSLSRLLLLEEVENIARTRKLLNRIEEFAVPGGNQRLLLEILQIKAALEEKAGEAEAAEHHLLKALQTGKAAGYFQVFLDGGTELVPVYARVIKGKSSGDEPAKKEIVQYARNIYQGAAQAAGTRGEKENKQAGQQEAVGQELVEKLSWREMEILELLAAGLSNQDISQKLFISVGTVKWYTSNIYGKLGVRGRTQAVTLARKLNLIS